MSGGSRELRRGAAAPAWIVFSVVLAGAAAAAQAQVVASTASLEEIRVQLRLVYWACVDPLRDPLCVSLEKDPDKRKGDCTDCRRWEERSVEKPLALDMGRDRYSDETGPPRGSQFLSEAARQLYGDEEAGAGVRISQLWEDPERQGWVEVDPGQELIGTIAVWPSIAGVVVKQRREGASDSAVVLYPSDRRQGELARTEARFMSPGIEPKFVVPRAVLDRAVVEGVQ